MTTRIEIIRGLALGGAETLLYQRLRCETELGLLDPRRVVVINTAPSDRAHFTEALTRLGASVITLSRRGVLRGAPELLGLIRESRPDTPLVLHSPGPGIALKAARALGILSNPIIEIAHSTQYRAVYQGLGQILNRFADACIAVSDDVAQARTAAGFAARTVIHGGVDKARMRRWVVEDGVAGAERLRQEIGIPVDAQLVVAVGNLVKLKGHENLVKSFARVQDAMPDAHLLIVGSGPEQASLIALAESLGLEDHVHLPGRIPDAWQLLAAGDVQCHPSIFEGLPVALMEGAALGMPAVVTDTPGMREFAQTVDDITVVPIGDGAALATALADKLDAAPPWQECFDGRGEAPSYWDITRYAKEMNEFVAGFQAGAA